ncbi:MAG: SDR family oxidoreductase [Candidatus Sericytochromatia bacterium]|nr:SDR family oxidoreductase [Candidatus Sericytochromatia bacterium]
MMHNGQHAQRVVLVTGASTGIGLALTRLLVAVDFRVIATARPESLPRFADSGLVESERLLFRQLELGDFESHKAVVAEAFSRWGRIDVLVNNAGIAYRSVVEDMSANDELQQLTPNYLGPMNLIRLVLPFMRRQRAGHIINVSSVSGMMAMPTMASYSASKWALEGASEALWYEMRPWGVRVCLIEPGFIHSTAFQQVRYPQGLDPTRPEAPYAPYYRHMSRLVQRLMDYTLATPESIAAQILRVIHQADPPLRVLATFDAQLFLLLRRLMPRALYHRLLYLCLPGVREWGKEPADDTPTH